MLKKIIGASLSFVVAVAMAIDGYLVFWKPHETSQAQTTSQTSQQAQSKSSSSTAASSSASSQGKFKNGTYTGKATSTQWGDVQVKVTVSGGDLAKITVLQSPNTNQKSIGINQQVLPTYKKEALKAQSAKIQQVSGATETYKGFTGSLQNALNQAEA